MNCIELRQLLYALKSERSNIESVWDIITRFVVPFRDDFYKEYYNENSIDWRTRGKFDDTAVIANSNLAANIHSALTNNIVRWFDLYFRDSNLNEVTEIKMWLEECVQVIWRSLQESNFDLEANELYLDLTSYGTGILSEEISEKEDTSLDELRFSALPLSGCWYEVDTTNTIMTLFRQYQWTPKQMADKFGFESLPDDLQERAMSPFGSTEKENVIYCIYKRKSKLAEGYDITAPENRQYGAKYFLEATAERLGKEDGYYEMPAFLPKWRKTAGSKFGHSQAMICLDDILTLNQEVQMILTAAEKVLDPALLTTIKGVFGDIDLAPGGVTVVQHPQAIQAFESGARFDVSNLTKKELQESINRCFFVDQLQLKESPAMTATEVTVRYQLMQRLLGPTLGRLQSDFLDPLIQRTFMILYRYRMLPPPPEQLRGRMSELDIEYLGSMARSQRLDEVQAMSRWVSDLIGISEAKPQILDRLDEDAYSLLSGQALGVPARVMKSDTAIKAERDRRGKKMAEQEQMMQAQQAAEIAKTAGEGGAALGLIPGGNQGTEAA